MSVLTRIRIDSRIPNIARTLTLGETLHGIIRASCQQATHPLWRLDEGPNPVIYMVSEQPPDPSVLAQLGAADSCDYTPFLTAITTGSVWRFRVTANTIRRHDGKPLPLTDAYQQTEWLLERLTSHGTRVPVNRIGMPTVTILDSGKKAFPHGKDGTITFTRTIFEGLLEVTDPDSFRHLLTHGLGRGRAYGHGLITLLPTVRTEEKPPEERTETM